MSHDLLLILGMAAATVVSRLLPVALAGRLAPTRFVRGWLESVPYAALGALIVPGIVLSDPATPWTGIAAGIAAAVVAFFGVPAYVAALASVAAALIVKLMG
jgi:branched-subunit amino acid transport protein